MQSWTGKVWRLSGLRQTCRVAPAHRAVARARGRKLGPRNAGAVAPEVDIPFDMGRAVAGRGDVEDGAAHVHGDDVARVPGRARVTRSLRDRGGAGLDRVDRLVRDQRARASLPSDRASRSGMGDPRIPRNSLPIRAAGGFFAMRVLP